VINEGRSMDVLGGGVGEGEEIETWGVEVWKVLVLGGGVYRPESHKNVSRVSD